jgi:hypothetical protein
MRPLRDWSAVQLTGTAAAWIALVLVLAFLTPPGRFLIDAYQLIHENPEGVNMEVPVTALKIWFVLAPLSAILPLLILIVRWRRARGRSAAV